MIKIYDLFLKTSIQSKTVLHEGWERPEKNGRDTSFAATDLIEIWDVSFGSKDIVDDPTPATFWL